MTEKARRERPDSEHAYYYNTETHEVEYGMLSPFTYRLGPYPTRRAAEHAREIAHARNEAWLAEEREWLHDDLEGDDEVE